MPIASLHTDHVAADNTRIVNFKYSTGQLIPASRIPGFAFHQVRAVCVHLSASCSFAFSLPPFLSLWVCARV